MWHLAEAAVPISVESKTADLQYTNTLYVPTAIVGTSWPELPSVAPSGITTPHSPTTFILSVITGVYSLFFCAVTGAVVPGWSGKLIRVDLQGERVEYLGHL
jgi:hypothetical protein